MPDVNTDSPLDEQVENTDNCQHNWNSTHDPNSKIYWIGQCMNCGKYNTDEINKQIELYCHKQVIEARINEVDGANAEMGESETEAYPTFWNGEDYVDKGTRLAELKLKGEE